MASLVRSQRIGLVLTGVGAVLLAGGAYGWVQYSSSILFWVEMVGWFIGVIAVILYGYGLFSFMFRR